MKKSTRWEPSQVRSILNTSKILNNAEFNHLGGTLRDKNHRKAMIALLREGCPDFIEIEIFTDL